MASPYELTDRRREGYRGRWRYQVIEKAVRGPRPRWSILFTTRNVATTFANQCGAFGVARAGQLLRASGATDGHDFKIEEIA